MKRMYTVPIVLVAIFVTLLFNCSYEDFYYGVNNDITFSNFNIRSSILGQRVGNIQTYTGHKPIYPHPKKTIDVMILPYKKGFKVVFKPLDEKKGHFICPLNNYILQDNMKKPFNFIANNKADYFTSSTSKKHGYVEGNTIKDSCSIYKNTTSWIIFGDKVDFDPSRSYMVIIGEIEDKDHKLAKIQIDIKNTLDNSYLTTNHTNIKHTKNF